MNKSERENKRVSALRLVILLIAAALLAAAAWFSCSHFLELQDARTVLYRAKTARLAAWSVSAECYAGAEPFADGSTEDGFAPGIGEKVQELSGNQGRIRLLRTTEDGYGILELAYTENGMTALYLSEDGEEAWRVVRQSVLITS